MDMKKGKALKKGDCVGIAAPAFYIDQDDFAQAVLFLKRQGYEVKTGASCTARDRYFSGDDALRAKDINAMFEDDGVDAVWCLRGGYGCARILDKLDYDMISRHPKLLIGYSDVTALHIALMQRCGLVTVHGPMASTFKGVYSEAVRETFLDGTAPERLRDADAGTKAAEAMGKLFSGGDTAPYRGTGLAYTAVQFLHGIASSSIAGEIVLPEGRRLETVVPGTAEGRLVGGNLTVLTSLVGTEYELRGDHMLLFLEDVGESAYRVDRMLNQLRQNGLLDRVDGILFGDFTEMQDTRNCTCAEVIETYAKQTGKPCVKGLPAGHDRDNMFLPFGVKVRMRGNENGAASIEFLEAALE